MEENKYIDNSKDMEKELTHIYDRFNHHFWNDELPGVMITFRPTKGGVGHMTSVPVWESSHVRKDKYELNISAFVLDRTPNEICETILHEQCHLYNAIHEIKDCSNEGRYHNSEFKKTAESHGLICMKDSRFGWAITDLDEDTCNYVKRLHIKQFAYRYKKELPSKNKLKRFQCPTCKKTTAWLTRTQRILCGMCLCELVYAPTRE